MDLLTRPIDFCQLAIILECRSRLTMTHQRSCGEWARIVQPPSTCLEYEMGGGAMKSVQGQLNQELEEML